MFYASLVVLVNEKREVLCLRRSDSMGSFKGMWGLPGGKAENTEMPEETLHYFAKNDKKRDGKGFIPITRLRDLGKPELYSLSVHNIHQLFHPQKEISA